MSRIRLAMTKTLPCCAHLLCIYTVLHRHAFTVGFPYSQKWKPESGTQCPTCSFCISLRSSPHITPSSLSLPLLSLTEIINNADLLRLTGLLIDLSLPMALTQTPSLTAEQTVDRQQAGLDTGWISISLKAFSPFAAGQTAANLSSGLWRDEGIVDFWDQLRSTPRLACSVICSLNSHPCPWGVSVCLYSPTSSLRQ